uniref:DUF6443 domain-containing protein n=1 Tax=Dysgonomonas capnocytophagoides TaxID=45254 RepID=UPI003341BE11
ITLKNGFSFSATETNQTLVLTVSPSTCDPFNGKDIDKVKMKSENYIREKTYLSIDGSKYIDAIQYFDGLGRPIEKIQRGITPKTKDLISVQEYDGIGRDSKSWLPAPITDNNGNFIMISTAKSSIERAYNDSAYSLSIYEGSPLNRILEQYGPGKGWYSNKARVINSYKTNTATGNLACSKYIVTATTSAPRLKKSGNYSVNQLHIIETIDEAGNITYEFKDKQGKTLLSRQINDSKNHDTYYVYDNWNNLCFVLPPLASDGLSADNTEWSETNESLKHYAYMYRYDHRNRCVKKKLPGSDFGWIHMVYDNADRLIFIQDGEQRTRKEWTFTIPDEMGRIRLSGICKDTINIYKKLVAAEYTGNTEYSGYTIKVDGTAQTLSSADIHVVNYYDNYKYQTLDEIKNLGLGYTSQSGFGTRYGDNSDLIKHKGLLTGSIEKILGETNKLYSAIYYDSNKRTIQSKSTNHLKGIESEYASYDYIGKTLQRLHIHTASGQATQTELYTYTYDHAGRLLTTSHKLNSGAEVLLSQNAYDELGRLSSATVNNQSKLKTSYSYNIRSWATNITNTHFIENLTYNNNGNISSQEWQQANKTRKYSFTYDNLSQIKSAAYTGDGTFGTTYTYDKHGNITSLKRNSSEGLLDNLTFEYTGNQLKKVTDTGIESQSNISADFKDYANAASEYSFNNNGAMTKDLNKGIQGISYNYMNLPQEMVINHSSARAKNYYTYTALGVKIRTIQKYDPSLKAVPIVGSTAGDEALTISFTSDYIRNKVYENNKLKRILIGNGYIEDGNYYFYVQDHLGNNRIVTNASANVIQSNQYYPFGMIFAEGSPAEQGKQPYKYNGKELDQMHGLNQYDYSARYYDPAIPRFISMDPMSEKYYSWSPYAYVGNNPLNLIDPNGQDWVYRVVDGVHEVYYDRSVTSQKEVDAKYGADKGMLHMGTGSTVTISNKSGEMIAQYTFTNDSQENKYGSVVDMNGNTLDNTQITSGSNYHIFGTSDKSVNAETLHRNYFNSNYIGPHNPTDYDGNDSYQFMPQSQADWAAYFHDLGYDLRGARGKKDAFFNFKIYPEDKILIDRAYYSILFNSSNSDRLRSLGIVAFFNTISLYKAPLYRIDAINNTLKKSIGAVSAPAILNNYRPQISYAPF